jgi:hypothetical protein
MDQAVVGDGDVAPRRGNELVLLDDPVAVDQQVGQGIERP